MPSDDQVEGDGMKVAVGAFPCCCAWGGFGGCGHGLGSLCVWVAIFEESSGTGAIFAGAAGADTSFGVSVSSLGSDSLNGDGEGPVKVSKKAESRKLDPIWS